MPSPFAMKLRKHLRNLRLENVTQLGNLDRVVDFRFGSGNYTHHLLLELYSSGNLILCNSEYKILGLLRTHEYEVKSNDNVGNEEEKEQSAEEIKVRVGNVYPVTFATTLSVDEKKSSSESDTEEMKGEDVASTNNNLLTMDGKEAYNWATAQLLALKEKAAAVNAELLNPSSDNNNNKGGKGGKKKGGKKKKKMDDSLVLKALLLRPNSGVYHYGPSLIEHCIRTAGLDPVLKLNVDNIEYTLPVVSWEDLITALRDEGSKVIHNLTSGENSGGYILYKPKATKDDDAKENEKKTNSLLPTSISTQQNPHSDKTLLEFQPHLLYQHKDQQYLKYVSFAVATDEFFSHLSSQRMAARADAAEAAAHERLAKIQADQQRRVDGLVKEQEKWKVAAQIVETHAEDVDRCLGVINGALATGMSWDQLRQLVIVEQNNENPIALLIHKLVLEKDQVVLALPDIDNWDQSDPDSVPPIELAIVSIKESAHGNARAMFAAYRASKEKGAKTIEASTTALKAAEAKARQQLAEAQKKKDRVQVQPHRKTYWFEKFAWFITSDNYLVVAGKDAQQNEQLVKRYLRPGDAYLHAEVHGAATCILRAKRRRRKDGKTQVIPLSDQALREAGTFTICRSSAWSSKMVTSAYWVESHQVSKTAPTGEYLTVGSFMIRGRKNFLPASSLEMGLGVLFRLGDETSIARHNNERRDFLLLEQEQILAEKEELEEKETEKQHPTPSKTTDEVEAPKEVGIEKLSITEEEETEVNTVTDNEPESPPSPDDVKTQPTESSNTNDKNVSFEKKSNPPPKKKKEKELSRGKRSKNKRAKQKYAEQDDEDRELAMLALHGGESSKKGKKGKKGSKIVAVDSELQKKTGEQTVALLVRDSRKVAETLDENVKKILATCVTVNSEVRWDKFDAEVLDQLGENTLEEQLAAANRLLELSSGTRVDNFSASLAGIIRTIKKHGLKFEDGQTQGGGDGKQRKSKAEKQAEKEAWQEILAEDGIVENDDDEDGIAVDDTAELGKLTGKPVSQDVILHAIPVCAPYSVLSQYKYRVKLTPGSVKRGKACKQSVEMFMHNEGGKKKQVDEGTRRDQALIKLVNENEWVQSMIGDVRITSAGASKVTKKQKGKAKGKKKK